MEWRAGGGGLESGWTPLRESMVGRLGITANARRRAALYFRSLSARFFVVNNLLSEWDEPTSVATNRLMGKAS